MYSHRLNMFDFFLCIYIISTYVCWPISVNPILFSNQNFEEFIIFE